MENNTSYINDLGNHTRYETYVIDTNGIIDTLQGIVIVSEDSIFSWGIESHIYGISTIQFLKKEVLARNNNVLSKKEEEFRISTTFFESDTINFDPDFSYLERPIPDRFDGLMYQILNSNKIIFANRSVVSFINREGGWYGGASTYYDDFFITMDNGTDELISVNRKIENEIGEETMQRKDILLIRAKGKNVARVKQYDTFLSPIITVDYSFDQNKFHNQVSKETWNSYKQKYPEIIDLYLDGQGVAIYKNKIRLLNSNKEYKSDFEDITPVSYITLTDKEAKLLKSLIYNK
ncbi:MAG: hypothetical protein P1U56_18475 [Saprospiraceae bacterium]|nr:hypothetical protein [Saprospiraceae bacterium]